MQQNRVSQICLFSCIALFSTPVFAYIDPGTGAMLVQALLALFAGALFYLDKFRAYLREWIKVIFRRKH
jgi:hypothetical protein